MHSRSLSLVLLSLLAASGCYASHELPSDGAVDSSAPDSSVTPDGGTDATRDADASFDADTDSGFDADTDSGFDAGLDAEVDSGFDAMIDAGGVDAEPPVGPHPNPDTCRIVPTVYPFDDPVLEYEWPNGPVVHAGDVHVCMTPLVIDLMPVPGADLQPVLVFVSYPSLGRVPSPGILRIVDPRTDTTISYPPREDQEGVLEATANLAAGDINNDGENEIVGLGTFAGTYAFRADGTLLWTSAYPRATDLGTIDNHSFSSGPAIADLDGDGMPEVIVGRTVLSGVDGSLVWTGDATDGIATNQFFGPLPCVADLDGDGTQEVIAGNTAFHADGSIYWKPAGLSDGICAVADLYADNPGPEVALVSAGYLRVLDGQTGETLWLRRLEGRVGTVAIGGPPTVADFDGDGLPEIGVANGSAYGVYDPACISPGHPAGCLGAGVLWTSPTSDASSSGTGSSVFDFNGDGKAEVIYNDEHYFRIYDGTTGTTLFQRRNSSRTRTENPTIADIDNDGDAEIIFSANAEAFYIRDWWTDPGVEIWGDARGRWVGSRRIWNEHSYHITNVEEDGSIPPHETPSWTISNSYRQNLREGADVLVVPDLWGGHGRYECLGSGRARLSVNVQNWGLERAGAGLVVAFYRGQPARGGVRVAEATTSRPLLARGDSEVVSVDVDLGGEVQDWYAVLDDPIEPAGGAINECREGNNQVLIWRPSCP